MDDKMKAAFDAWFRDRYAAKDRPTSSECAEWATGYLRSQQEPVATVGRRWLMGLGFDLNDFSESVPAYGTKLYAHPLPSAPAVFEDLQGMSTMSRTISYAAAYKLRELGYEWDSQELQWTGAPAVPGWQPIETAPNDGTSIMAYWLGVGQHDCSIHAAKFHKGRWWEPNEDFPLSEPTHWMPLPAAPSPTEKEGS